MNKKAFFALWNRIDSGKILFRWINNLSVRTTFLLSTLMLVVIAAADYFSHVELTISPWYTFPCFLVDWRIGRWPAIGYAVFALALQLFVGLTGAHDYPNLYYLYGDLVINLAYCVILIWIIAKLRLALEMECILSRDDFLTRLGNRESLLADLGSEIERCHRHGKSLTVVMIDLDNFKRFNAARGHSTGDLLLAAMGDALRNQFRDTDIIARSGDDEFMLILPTMSTDVTESKLQALRQSLSNLLMVRGWDITFGMGAIVFVRPAISGEQVMAELQNLMQTVKQSGANGYAQHVLSIDNPDIDVKLKLVRQAC